MVMVQLGNELKVKVGIRVGAGADGIYAEVVADLILGLVSGLVKAMLNVWDFAFVRKVHVQDSDHYYYCYCYYFDSLVVKRMTKSKATGVSSSTPIPSSPYSRSPQYFHSHCHLHFYLHHFAH